MAISSFSNVFKGRGANRRLTSPLERTSVEELGRMRRRITEMENWLTNQNAQNSPNSQSFQDL